MTAVPSPTTEIEVDEKAVTETYQVQHFQSIFKKCIQAIQSPGKHCDIRSAAPTQQVFDGENFLHRSCSPGDSCSDYKVKNGSIVECENIRDYIGQKRPNPAGRIFDLVTHLAGTSFVFILTLVILVVWAIVGGIYHAPDSWQIVMQDGSSIQCYISATLLMRQQQNHHNQLTTMIAQLRSRLCTIRRLIGPVLQGKSVASAPLKYQDLQDDVGDAQKLPVENWFSLICNYVSLVVGSVYFFMLYWAGIFIWVGFGKMLNWSDEWQLYINTATAVELTFTSVFLQNIRHRHMKYISRCVSSIFHIDAALEEALRRRSGDRERNPVIEIEAEKVNVGSRTIDYYAHLVGSGVGAVISAAVFIVWLAIGNTMHWNSNWWLIIGTYTGLVGFLDGFALRNVYFRESNHFNVHVQTLVDEEYLLFQSLGLPLPHDSETPVNKSFAYKLSSFIGYICSQAFSVYAAVIIIVGLVVAAGALRFNETAQLFCNTPTMIIEAALLIVLIEAHNFTNLENRVKFRNIHLRRLALMKAMVGDDYLANECA
ncbi:plasma membrane iron/zinc ion transmembrane transporter [Schizosaccharomyces osmophilus]|uniref:Plasma membrane iron/zinc ion transmembrane transporter n=1 Tax=Schizosaccharomyces osmophilus TaxID=2545709 RepID=A0AAE9WBE9_9SCHI|nr:plasma membrane iron/zinc ion transmembrane transporter [Schizosaccharomyces osmophilus]WBW72162.1 plasma membrane iron/zinc ion transmembrane transporter [Schizosaccharomyces osmophilus]